MLGRVAGALLPDQADPLPRTGPGLAVHDPAVGLRRVDAAMYPAEQRGRGCFQVLSDDMIAAPQPTGIATISAHPQSLLIQ